MNKTWFITGASAGFGRAFAEYAIGQGYNVVLTARTLSKLEEVASLAPERTLAVAMDVTKPSQIEDAVVQATERFKTIDVLINNAGFGMVGAVEETPEEELRALFETNFFGAINVTKSLLPTLRKQRSGAIVNISSMGGQIAFAGFGPYCATKFALEGMSEALRVELEPLGIKTMIVEPGAFRTDFAGSALRHMPRIDDYEQTVGGTRDFASGMHGTQEGDPAKAAAAVDRAIQADNTPLRLVLGNDAVDAVRDHSYAVLKDIETWESVSRDVAVVS